MTPDSAPILALFEALMRADTLESAVQGAARYIGEATQAATSGLVIVIHGGLFLEAWEPEDPSRSHESFQAVRKMVMQAAHNGTAAYMPIEDSRRGPMVARVLHLDLRQRLSGAVCVISPSGANPQDGVEGDPLERLARLVAMRLNGLLELESERRKSQQFERWFRVSDRQIRALDLERQKFAALVSSFAGGAFVADRGGVISWQSRPLLTRSAGASNTWVGRPCSEFCQTLGGGGQLACGDCLVEQVLQHRQSATCRIVLDDGSEGRVMQASAAPINDLAGRAQEVMVTFQDAAPQGYGRSLEEAA
jgi:PAS domain-containing protein